jgi:CelD/BcsL family acetyltransferase involved in cellulose biosynthesis
LDHVFRDTWQAKTFGYTPRDTGPQRRYLCGIAERGWLRSYLLVNDQRPIAFGLGYQYDNVYYFAETGFVQDFSDYGPGTVLMHLFIEDFYHVRRPEILDFGLGDAAYKRSFGNVRREAAAVYLVPSGRWRLVIALQRAIYAVESKVRRLLIALRLDRAVRKLLKRQR